MSFRRPRLRCGAAPVLLGLVGALALTGTASAASTSVTAPSAPRAVTASTNATAVTVKWQPPATTGGADIDAYGLTCSSTDGGAALTGTAAGTAKTATLTGPTSGRTYLCRVSATNAAGTSPSGTAADYVEHAVFTPSTRTAVMTLPVKTGQRATLADSGSTLSSGACATQAIRGTDGRELTNGCLYQREKAYVSTVSTFTSNGTATATLTASGSDTGSVEQQAWVFSDLRRTTSVGGPAVAVRTTAPYQVASLTFSGQAGGAVQVAEAAANVPGTISLRDPTGNEVLFGRYYVGSAATAGPVTLPSTGTYTLLIVNDGAGVGGTSFRVLAG